MHMMQGLCASMANDYITTNPTPEFLRMNGPDNLSMKTDEVLRVELEVFRREHRDLDDAIAALGERASADQLTLKRLKKRKLRLRDQIAMIEDRLTPDIIA